MKICPPAFWSTITVPPKPEEDSSGRGPDVDPFVWITVGVVALLLGVVLLAVFHHWLVGWQFKQRRKTAALAAKTRPRRFTGDQVPPRR